MHKLLPALAFLVCCLTPAFPEAQATPTAPGEPGILTPPPPAEPRINGPKITGVRPGSPFLYRIPCTGERPVTFSARGLPAGLSLDSQTGIISGQTRVPGVHAVTLTARNPRGECRRELRIAVGDRLALTPPMGWNSWYIHYNRISEALMRQAADQMIASGMADFGYQYVNCDDCWMAKRGEPPYRDASGRLLPGPKFPDIAGMVAHIHSLGLRAGTYTSPGPWTCGKYTGAYGHEADDARQFAAWGFDFLKYDLCSYRSLMTGKTPADYEKPYRLMSDNLRRLDRDVVFNLCEYGLGDVWTWGGDVGNSWRTTGDLGAVRASDLPGFYKVALRNEQHWPNARPGAWNDPDYILIGWVGDAFKEGQGEPTALTPSEQYSYMSLWSLMASPLIFSGDMARLDPFTINVLCNSEVIDVDQDPLGRQGRIVRQTPAELIMVRELEDGSRAVGLFNLSGAAREIKVRCSELGLGGRQSLRDLWRQTDLGDSQGECGGLVPRHGVLLLKVSPLS